MSGIAAIDPVTVLDLAERLQWPCEPEEALTVIMHMDDEYREINQPSKT